ncbi:hypothetical protein Ahy_B02g057176 isoform D [Arachis hypogaea]|uniref:Uncharacterized protein n=1 Tax=Arachis hypogaea TaxID=3818 RepID=A0A445AB46_ARAHY|nr:hypothetical protein Ahy_B02g057176 isoform D [Arachis hypogaea]
MARIARSSAPRLLYTFFSSSVPPASPSPSPSPASSLLAGAFHLRHFSHDLNFGIIMLQCKFR